MNLIQYKYPSSIGTLYLVASHKGLCGIFWEKQKAQMLKTPEGVIKQTVDELEEYFNGKRTSFRIPLDIQGTDFQLKVWKELRQIPYGTTISYSELAKRIENEKAVRAVGSANGRNPLCIIIPCHRVIAADGSLGGYSGGLSKKEKLLQIEKR